MRQHVYELVASFHHLSFVRNSETPVYPGLKALFFFSHGHSVQFSPLPSHSRVCSEPTDRPLPNLPLPCLAHASLHNENMACFEWFWPYQFLLKSVHMYVER